jgi:hypothetical protein
MKIKVITNQEYYTQQSYTSEMKKKWRLSKKKTEETHYLHISLQKMLQRALCKKQKDNYFHEDMQNYKSQQ